MIRLLQVLLLIGLALFVASAIHHDRRRGPHHGPRDEHGTPRRDDGPAGKHGRDRGRPRPPRPAHIRVHDRDVRDEEVGTQRAIRTISGRVSATEERARDDARRALVEAALDWLEPPVPSSWTPPPHLVDRLIVETRITPEEKPYGTVYTAALDADFSDARRGELVDAYRHVVSRDRALKLGAVFGFLLVCLGAVSGYIRADEATKGYFTNRLRLAAAAAVGASGVVLIRWLA